MANILTYVGCAILACLSVFQLALAMGAPIGKYAWGGANRVLPPKLRIASATSIGLYVFFGLVLVAKAGFANVIGNISFVDTAIWVIAIYFCIGVAMNAISRSKSERNLMTPVALLLAVVFLYVAQG